MVAAEPPTVTPVAPARSAPVMVIVVPPPIGPLDGATLAMVGRLKYVKDAGVATEVPPGVVTTTARVPVPVGVVAVITPAASVRMVAAAPPTVTPVAPA